MKKTTRLVISLCMVALSVFILCFGVWAAVVAEYKITGKVSYSVDNVNMRFQIEASISNASSDANENVEISNSTFSYSNASDINEVLNSWNLGSIYFIKNYSNGGETLTVPDIVITIIWFLSIKGASFNAYATAWADSIAGIMPSVRARYSKAQTASSSVMATYSALPISYR